MLISGDIGGTKTRLALYRLDGEARAPLMDETFRSRDYESLEAILEKFLAGRESRVERAIFGVAGPVVSGRARITNLPWVIDCRAIQEKMGFSQVELLNDLEAIANAIPILEPHDLVTLNPGTREEHGAIAVIGPGTGLGEAYLTWDGSRYRAYPTEGGHVDFGPVNEEQMALWQFLKNRFNHISYERICSGSGIPNIYEYYKETGLAPEPDWLAEALAETHDPTPVIVQTALDPTRECALCSATLTMFVSVLGAEAGNLALKVFATGGVYLGGGIPPKILPSLQDGLFMQAFLNKGRFAALLEAFPVIVIQQDKTALYGAAYAVLHR